MSQGSGSGFGEALEAERLGSASVRAGRSGLGSTRFCRSEGFTLILWPCPTQTRKLRTRKTLPDNWAWLDCPRGGGGETRD